MTLAFDKAIEVFDKLKKLVYVIDERTQGRMQIEMADGNDYAFRIKFYFEPKTSENRNTMITIVSTERQILIWYNYLNEPNLADYFLKYRTPSLNDLWNTKRFDYDFDSEIDIDTIVENTNAVLDVFETGMKIREKARKQLEINFEKYKELKVKGETV